MKNLKVLLLTPILLVGCSDGPKKVEVEYLEPELTEERRLELESQFLDNPEETQTEEDNEEV